MGKDVVFVFRSKQKKYFFQKVNIFHPKEGEFEFGTDEVHVDKLGNSWLKIDFSLFIPDNEQNVALLEEVEVDIKPPFPEYFRLKKEFDENLSLLRKNKKGNNLVLGNFCLSFRGNHIEIDGASSSMSEFLCRCDETINLFKNFCRELNPIVAGMTIESYDPIYLKVFVNKNKLIPLCAWDEKQERIPDIEVSYIGPELGACLYWFSKDTVSIIAYAIEKHLSMRNEAKRLRSIFKENSTDAEFVISQKEIKELKEIFSDISSIYKDNFHEMKKILSTKEYDLISDAWRMRDFLYEMLKKRYLIKIFKSEYMENL